MLGVLAHLLTCVLCVDSFTEHVATTAWLAALTIFVAPSKSTFVLAVGAAALATAAATTMPTATVSIRPSPRDVYAT